MQVRLPSPAWNNLWSSIGLGTRSLAILTCIVVAGCTAGSIELLDAGCDGADQDGCASCGADDGDDGGGEAVPDGGGEVAPDGGSDPGADPGQDAGGDDANDPHQICIAKINALRATKTLAPYTRWASAESCVDGQATSDEQSGTPHGAFGACGEMGQNECLGGGVAGIVGCLDSMWAEKNQAGCAGCDACADSYNPNCPNCDFYGQQTGDVCGHYVNMSAKYMSAAACGFSSLGGWSTIDFR